MNDEKCPMKGLHVSLYNQSDKQNDVAHERMVHFLHEHIQKRHMLGI